MIQTMKTPGPPIARRDIAIAVVIAIGTIALTGWARDKTPSGTTPPTDALAGVVSLLYTVPLLWRRRYPVLAAAGTLAGLAVHVIAYGSLTRCGLAIPELFLEAFAVAAYLDGRPAALGIALMLGASVVMLSEDSSAGWGGLTIAVPGILIVAAIGRVVRSRSRLVEHLSEHTAELRQAREANAKLEVATERVRLSAELDELLRTRLAELAQLADAGGGQDALRHIETESRATLDQMRAVVGLLREDETPGTEPQPTLTHLDALLLRAKGADAELHVTGNPRVLPAGLELSAYRVIEHLLAATDDAPGIEVGVDFGPEALEVTVSGPTRRRSEAAIERARERVVLQRGTLDASSRDGRTSARAAFPMPGPGVIRSARGRLELVAPASAAVVAICAAAGFDAGVPFFLATAAGFFAGRARHRLAGAAGMAVLLAACVADSTGDDIVPMVMLPATMFAAGVALRAREAVAERLAAQAEELEAERELYARLSVRYERSRIAAELHDVVAHAISVMVVQAGAGQRLASADPAAAEETFAIIGAAARQAEADLDGLADLLAQDDDGGDLRLVREIVSRASASGLPVVLRLDGEGERLRGAAAHAVSRVVQEGLTNALRYAPGASVLVTVSTRPARVDVEVANGAGTNEAALGLGSGHGLTGLRERVAACGGTFAAGPDSSGGWAVRASIPRVAVATG